MDVTLTEVARTVEVSPATLRRWVREGIVPLRDDRWRHTTRTGRPAERFLADLAEE
jgi:transposase-like protein